MARIALPPCPIVASKVVLSVQHSKGIPHESKILTGVRFAFHELFAFHGSKISFSLYQAKNEIDQSHTLLIIFPNEYFHQRSSSINEHHTQQPATNKNIIDVRTPVYVCTLVGDALQLLLLLLLLLSRCLFNCQECFRGIGQRRA